MASVIRNIRIAADVYRLTVDGQYSVNSGQFYMLRAWDRYPVLSRPISVHDAGPDSISFLFRVAGIGTQLLAGLAPGDPIQLDGPYGNGFPLTLGRTALIGGGIGLAPLLLTARRNPSADVYLGFSGEPFGTRLFRELGHTVTVVSGGTIADHLNLADYDTVLACGPAPLLQLLIRRAQECGTRLYVSVESRLACGIGVCCGCTVHAADGTHRKLCVDGPVFPAQEVDEHHFISL